MELAKSAVALCLVCLLGGCGAGLERPDPLGDIAASTGFSDAVQFRVDGSPVDLPSASQATLTFPESIRRALGTDPRLQAALSRFRQALADADQARLLPNPVLDLAMRYPESGGSPLVEVGVVADIARVFQKPWRAGAAEKRLRVAAAEAVSQALDVVTDVEKTYADAQAADRVVEILGEQRTALERLVQVSRDRLEAGEGTRADVTTIQARRADILVQLAERRLEGTVARLRLARLIGSPSSDPDWRLEPWTAPDPSGLSEEAWIEAALSAHPQIEARRWELAALRDERVLARFAPFTEVDVGASAEREEGSWGVGPALGSILPIFDFGSARRAKARAVLAEARHQLTLAERGVIEDVRRSYATFSAARKNLKLARENLLPAQKERYDRIRDAYLAGEVDATDLYLAEQDLRTAQIKVIELERSLSAAFADLERAAGGAARRPEPGGAQPRIGDGELMEEKNQ